MGEHFVNFKHYIRVPLPDNNESHVPGALKLLHEAPHCLGKSYRIAACVQNAMGKPLSRTSLE